MRTNLIRFSLVLMIILAISGLTAWAQTQNSNPNKTKPGVFNEKPQRKGFGLPMFVKVTDIQPNGFKATLLAKERAENLLGKIKPERTERLQNFIQKLKEFEPITFIFNEKTNQTAKHETLKLNQIKVGQTLAVSVLPEDIKKLIQKEEKVLALNSVSTVEAFINSIKERFKEKRDKEIRPLAKFGIPVPVEIVSLEHNQAKVKTVSRDDFMPKPQEQPKEGWDNKQRTERRAEMQKKLAALGTFRITLPNTDKIYIDGKPNGQLKTGMLAIVMIDPGELKEISDGKKDLANAKAILDKESFKQFGKKIAEGIKERIKDRKSKKAQQS